MLYRTHHLPLFRQFPSITSSPLSLLSSPFQVQGEMECVEAALKTSIRTELTMKSSPQAFLEDIWAVNVHNGASCDDFFVDELLDFPNEEGFTEEEEEEKTFPVSVSPKQESPRNEKNGDHSTNFSAKEESLPVPASELGVPADDLASLEWLSNFVEDSNSEYSTPFPAGILLAKAKSEDNPESAKLLTEPCFKTPFPAKARSKRARTAVRVWSSGSPSLTTDSSSSPTTSSSSSSTSSPWLICVNPGSKLEPAEPFCSEKPPEKKYKKKPALEAATAGCGAQQQPRRCSHCGVPKTPQWRTGPLGAKTLCNACGVRYKSGRLLPEYRPACSPTFSSELHSNHHRKVLEMRKQKEISGQVEPGFPPLAMPGF
ncbi:hypothetical protein K2173_023455 [Erythroxylum novogranatense]|uniref:GATA-type domain-containing protein n=1 Tax=Erythroxylum novogranatense TaxID=1862640 RepID=A0AAV8TVZ2_9ROSI|nr:hypothetical protein K2173_023455 [Erythroxylum novogranatense]